MPGVGAYEGEVNLLKRNNLLSHEFGPQKRPSSMILGPKC